MTDTGYLLLLFGWWLLGLPLLFQGSRITTWHPLNRNLRALIDDHYIEKPKSIATSNFCNLIRIPETSPRLNTRGQPETSG